MRHSMMFLFRRKSLATSCLYMGFGLWALGILPTEGSHLLAVTAPVPAASVPPVNPMPPPAAVMPPQTSVTPAPIPPVAAMPSSPEKAPEPPTSLPAAPKSNMAQMPSPTPSTPTSAVSPQKQSTEPVPMAGDPKRGADAVPEGLELVNIDFAEKTDIKDIIKAVALWTGKNVLLDRNVSGQIQIISPKKVTKEEAYQAFLSALNMLGFTTVETGKIIKIVKVQNAVKGNLKTYVGGDWAPRTDEIITQIVHLKYVDSKTISNTLSKMVSTSSLFAYEPTNTLIVSDTGYKVNRVLEILELLDVKTQQPQVSIIPIKYSDPKSVSDKVNEILRAAAQGGSAKGSGGFNAFKIMTDDRTNSIIIFGPPRAIKDVQELVYKFDIAIDDPSLQASIHVRPLDYADAKKLSSTLSSLTSGNKPGGSGVIRKPPVLRPGGAGGDQVSVADIGEGVKVTADDASNSLIITGNKNAYDSLNAIIRKLDVRRSQVFVETDILDINQNNNFKFGTSIFAGSGNSNGQGTKSIIGWEGAGMKPLIVAQTPAAQVTSNGVSSLSPQALGEVASSFSSNMKIGILAGESVNLPGIGKISPGAMIDMIKADANARVVSSPHILTSNNEEATITVGEKQYFKVSSKNPATGVESKEIKDIDIDLTLTIKPNISYSNYVTMQVNLDSNSIAGTTEDGMPRVAKRKSKQNVTVKNGQTVVISGLVRNSELENYKKIPFLGDIPILGWLFRNSGLDSVQSDLLIFLTPRVIHGAQDLAAIYKTKVEERDEFLSKVYGSNFKNDRFYQSLRTLEHGQYNPTEADKAEERVIEEQHQAVYKAIGLDPDKEKAEKDELARKRAAQKTETLPVPVLTTGGSSGAGAVGSAGAASSAGLGGDPSLGGLSTSKDEED